MPYVPRTVWCTTGAEYFGSSQGSLRGLVEGWADEAQLPAVLILDHGPAERAWPEP